MTEALDRNVDALNGFISGAWRRLADSSLTTFDRRELRNSMKEAEVALKAALERIAEGQRARRHANSLIPDARIPDFRILRLEA